MLKRSHLITLIFIFAFVAALALPGCDELITETIIITRFDTTLGEVCLQCHTDVNDALIIVPKGQWENSAHASFDLLEATVDVNGTSMNTAVCGPVCHSGNGFVDFVLTGNQGTQPKPSVINCFTCHMPHSGNFGSFQLTTLRGLDTTGVLLNSLRRYNLGKSNMCVECHQSQPKPTIGPITTIGTDFGPHFSAQADMLIGAGAFIVDSGDVTNSHRKVKISDGCLNCHFGDGVGFSFGEHTFKLEDESKGTQFLGNCDAVGCHATDNLTSLYDFPILDSVRIMADSLQFLLTSLNILDSTDSAGVRFNANIDVPRASAEMLQNYLLYRMDGSKGVHNAKFADTLLRASLASFGTIPVADFLVVGDTVICASSTVIFADLSANETSWTWDFGDGTTSSGGGGDAPGDAHTYLTPGSYTVSLTINGPGGQASVTKVNHINVFDSVTAAFLPDVIAGPPPLEVTFADSSLGGPTTWVWDFGDGTFNPSENFAQNPVHVFDTLGSYVVRLTVFNGCSADSTVAIDTIQVQ